MLLLKPLLVLFCFSDPIVYLKKMGRRLVLMRVAGSAGHVRVRTAVSPRVTPHRVVERVRTVPMAEPVRVTDGFCGLLGFVEKI